MTFDISNVYDVLDDPGMRTATGFQTFLTRAWIDPDWGSFLHTSDCWTARTASFRAR